MSVVLPLSYDLQPRTCPTLAVDAPDGLNRTFSNGGIDSPILTPSSRPGSGRSRAVQLLTDAVRSKDENRLADTLEYLKHPSGGVAGLSERHMVTGRTPLHEAVILNSLSTVQMLLEAGADPNISHASQVGWLMASISGQLGHKCTVMAGFGPH